jgi:hypothetical protein
MVTAPFSKCGCRDSLSIINPPLTGRQLFLPTPPARGGREIPGGRSNRRRAFFRQKSRPASAEDIFHEKSPPRIFSKAANRESTASRFRAEGSSGGKSPCHIFSEGFSRRRRVCRHFSDGSTRRPTPCGNSAEGPTREKRAPHDFSEEISREKSPSRMLDSALVACRASGRIHAVRFTPRRSHFPGDGSKKSRQAFAGELPAA